MDRTELKAILERGPARICMNDGSEFVVDIPEWVVSDIALCALDRGVDGKLHTVYLPLVTMTAVHPLAPA